MTDDWTDQSNPALRTIPSIDPHFAEARRYHAFNYITTLLNGYTNDTTVLDKAEEELRPVAREAPDLQSLPSAQVALYFTQGRRELIPLERLDQMIREHPAQNDTLIWRLILHIEGGENVLAKALARQMPAREPNFGPPRWMLGEILRTEGDIAGAIREHQAVLELAPANLLVVRLLALAYMDNGDLDKARALLEEKRTFQANYLWRHTWAVLLAVEGKRSQALQIMDQETLQFARVAYAVTAETADFYAALEDPSKAIDWIRQAVRDGGRYR